MADLDLGLIGNCTFAALVDRNARISWACLPRFDSDPTFCSLLDGKGDPEKGFYEIAIENQVRSEQTYLPNTAILRTTLFDDRDNAVEITDFAPRFEHWDRSFRPTTIIRIIKPIGTPRITIRLRPTYDYGRSRPSTTHGSNHVRLVMPELTLRLTTDVSVSHILEETPFLLEEESHLILGPDESLTQPVSATAKEFLERTSSYWHRFSRLLSIPFEWQEAVIRAAITLKLCSWEESGAIVAAVTTSIPEAPDSGRNWDYRFCWLRDAYFTVNALNRLGATRTMEGYIRYMSNIVAGAPDGYLQPVFSVTFDKELHESEVESLPGYRNMGPVRIGNLAYQQVQNDGYGGVILASAHAFFDSRLVVQGNGTLFERLERVGEQAVKRWNEPDAGPWELRQTKRVHTYSAAMCWAAADRLARIAGRLGLEDRAGYWRDQAVLMRDTILERSWSEEKNTYVDSFEGDRLDASLLLLPALGFMDAREERFLSTLAAIEAQLVRNGYVFRYTDDEYGAPETAFTICTFWYIEALAAVGRADEARSLFEKMLASRNHLGLLSEDLDPNTGELWGNFPQTYSMVGIISAATRLSITWEEAF